MRTVRCQGIIIKGDKILVLRQYNSKSQEEYWLLPGGNVEEGETPEEAIIRELKEETNLQVEEPKILFDKPSDGRDFYIRYVTFICVPKENSKMLVGKETSNFRKILDLVWCSVVDENSWNKYLLKEQFFPSMKEIKNKLIEIGLI